MITLRLSPKIKIQKTHTNQVQMFIKNMHYCQYEV